MKTVREVEHDADEIARWITQRADDFAPLDIVSVSATPDDNADDELIIFVTVVLNPPADGDGWRSADTIRLYQAVHRWGYDAGYAVPPHVHLQAA